MTHDRPNCSASTVVALLLTFSFPFPFFFSNIAQILRNFPEKTTFLQHSYQDINTLGLNIKRIFELICRQVIFPATFHQIPIASQILASHSEFSFFRTRILAKSTSSRSRRFGRPSKPTVFKRWYEKNRIMKSTENRRHLPKTKGDEKNTPLGVSISSFEFSFQGFREQSYPVFPTSTQSFEVRGHA